MIFPHIRRGKLHAQIRGGQARGDVADPVQVARIGATPDREQRLVRQCIAIAQGGRQYVHLHAAVVRGGIAGHVAGGKGIEPHGSRRGDGDLEACQCSRGTQVIADACAGAVPQHVIAQHQRRGIDMAAVEAETDAVPAGRT